MALRWTLETPLLPVPYEGALLAMFTFTEVPVK